MWALGVAAVLGGAAVAAATPSSVIAWSSEPRYALLSPHLVRVSARTQAPNFCQFPKSALGERSRRVVARTLLYWLGGCRRGYWEVGAGVVRGTLVCLGPSRCIHTGTWPFSSGHTHTHLFFVSLLSRPIKLDFPHSIAHELRVTNCDSSLIRIAGMSSVPSAQRVRDRCVWSRYFGPCYGVPGCSRYSSERSNRRFHAGWGEKCE